MSVNYQKAFLAPMLEKESDDDNDNSIQSKPINYFNTNSSMLNETRILNHPTIFLYKGVGFSFVKSFRSLQSFGMNLKVPITTHFPQYDRRQYLPRVGASIGMYFPIDYKCTFSFSIPILTAFYGVAVLAKKVRIGNRDYNKEFISSGDPNRRLGFAVSFRYSLIKGFRITFGPWVNQLSNRQLIDTILPFFIVIPTLVLFCVNIVTAVLKAIMNGFLFLVMSKTRGDNSSIQPEFITSTVATDNTSINVSSSSTHNQISNEMSTANDDQLHLSASKQSSNQTTTKKNKNSDKNKINKIASKKKFSRKKYDPRALHSRILQYVSSKGPGMGCSAGTYITRDDGIYLGGNTFIDIQGLYPFKSELLYLCDQIVELKNGISTAVGSWYKSIFNFRPKGDTAASDIDINDQRNHMSETNNNGYIDNNNTIPFTELRGGHIASKNTTKRSRRSRNKSSK